MATEKFIVAAKQWGLEFLKETVYRGSVLEVDCEKNSLTIDGRKFTDVRDIDIAKRQAERFPDNPLIVPFSPDNLARLRTGVVVPVSKPKPGENMKIVQSDEDLHDTIDIADTQVSRKNREAKEAERQKAKVEKLPIIKGDESPEERVERLREEKRNEKMPIVRDDSLGAEGGSKAASLNAGQKLPTLDEVKAKEEKAKQLADVRKKEAEAKRAALVTSEAEGGKELQDLVLASETKTSSGPDAPSPATVPPEASRLDALEKTVNGLADTVNNLVKTLNPDSYVIRRPVPRRTKKITEPTE
jgi:hypothetical protein